MQYSTEAVLNAAKALRDDAAGNKQASMTDLDMAVSMLEALAAERDELASWKELVSNGSMLQALRDKAERERDQLRAALQLMLENHVPKVNPFSDAAVLSASSTLAKITATGQRYKSLSKGGSYTKLGVIRGAGALKGLAGIAYQNDKGDLFVREPECFAKRMVLAGGGA